MTPYEYYSNLIKYKKKDVSSKLYDGGSLKHAGTYKPSGTHEYVAVLPDFWGKGKHRYFYTQQEWNNYNKNKAQAEGSKKAEQNKEDKKNPNVQKKLDEYYNKNKAGAGQGERSRYESNWEKGKYYNVYNYDKESSMHDTSDNIRMDAGVSIYDDDLSKQLNEFYNEVQVGSFVTAFDSSGRKALDAATYGGKNSEGYKNLLSRIKKSTDLYERDRDKFEKKLRETIAKQYNGDPNDPDDYRIQSDVKKVMDKLDENYEKAKNAYKDITEDYYEWRKEKIRNKYSNYLKNGLTNGYDIQYLKKNGIDASISRMLEGNGINKENGYDQEAIDILKDVFREICKNTK